MPVSNTNKTQIQDGSPVYRRLEDMEEHMSKTVVVVIWHKENVDPLRLHLMVPTFPDFRISQCQHLISDLGLSESYLETWDPSLHHWQQDVSAIRVIKSQQRLLYRIRRPSLSRPLSDSEFRSLYEELQLQEGKI